MVGVVVGVDDVGYLVGYAVRGRDLVDGALQVVPDGGGRVEQHPPVLGGQKRGLIGAIGDPVQVLLHPADEVALRVDGRAQRGRRDRREVGQRIVSRGRGGRRGRLREDSPGQAGDRGHGREHRATREEGAAVCGGG